MDICLNTYENCFSDCMKENLVSGAIYGSEKLLGHFMNVPVYTSKESNTHTVNKQAEHIRLSKKKQAISPLHIPDVESLIILGGGGKNLLLNRRRTRKQ